MDIFTLFFLLTYKIFENGMRFSSGGACNPQEREKKTVAVHVEVLFLFVLLAVLF